MSSGVALLERPYISFSSPFILILGREITAAAVALFFLFSARSRWVDYAPQFGYDYDSSQIPPEW